MSYAIEIKNLDKNYSDFQLKNVSFNVETGSIMGFIGENGAGKSTTIKAILNLIKKDGGEVFLLGKDNIKNEHEIKEDIGVVFDEIYFHQNLSPKDLNNIFKKFYKRWDTTLFYKYLSQFNLDKAKIIKELSKGMKAKLNIAVALAHSPKLLIMDEATTGLDPVVRDEVLDVFYEFVQNKTNSILMSTHITTDLDKIADNITFIHKGEIIFTDKKENILSKFAVARCSQSEFDNLNKNQIFRYKHEPGFIIILTNNSDAFKKDNPSISVEKSSIEDIMLLNIKGERP